MSTFYKQTKHPETNEWDFATWIDDYYGRHRYGVMFPSGEVFNPEKIKLETREAEPKTDVNKPNFIEQKMKQFESEILTPQRGGWGICPSQIIAIENFIEQALKEQAKQTKLTTDDMQQVGEHYWGGDYSPSSMELIKLTDAVNEMIISKHK